MVSLKCVASRHKEQPQILRPLRCAQGPEDDKSVRALSRIPNAIALGPKGWAQRNSGCDNLKRAALSELVAQLVEQRPFKAWVLGSIPSELTTQAACSLSHFSLGVLRS